jgi:hypothetical protein
MSSTKTLYVRNRDLWDRARQLAGDQGLSEFVERALQELVDRQTKASGEGMCRQSLAVGGDSEAGDMNHNIEFDGQLLVDSRGFSVEQLPRLRVYVTARGRFVVYRTWPPRVSDVAPSFDVYPDLETLECDPTALSTMWITQADPPFETTDLTPQLVKSIRKALGRRPTILVDEMPLLKPPREMKQVRLGRDASVVRQILRGQKNEHIVGVAIHLLSGGAEQSHHLSQIQKTYRQIAPVSLHGKTPDTYKDEQAVIRSCLNYDTSKRNPAQRLFVNPRRGYWALSKVGGQIASGLLRQHGVARA